MRSIRLAIALVCCTAIPAGTQPLPPPLTEPVNDFARVIDPSSAAILEQRIRGLMKATEDVIVVATVETVQPYADIREYAVKMFENRGRGIAGAKQDTGVLLLVAVKDRQVRIETGYGLEEFVTDGFAGETSRSMTPYFREGRYGEGIVAGVERLARRIEEARGIRAGSAEPPQSTSRPSSRISAPLLATVIILVLIVGLPFAIALMTFMSRSRRRRRRGPWWGAGPWSGWNSGVGPFGGSGGGFGGGFGGFSGGGGGFGGFGGGMSGGGGGGASW